MASIQEVAVEEQVEMIEEIQEQTIQVVIAGEMNAEKLLMPLPYGIAAMKDLKIMATYLGDFSLQEQTPLNGFQHIENPNSFQACLMQISNASRQAFVKAHVNMDGIWERAKNMPDYVQLIDRILLERDADAIEVILPDQLDCIVKMTEICSELAEEVINDIKKVVDLTNEVSVACTALQGSKGEKNKKAEQELQDLQQRIRMVDAMQLHWAKEKTKAEMEAMIANINLEKAMNDGTFAHVITAGLVAQGTTAMLAAATATALGPVFWIPSAVIAAVSHVGAQSKLYIARNQLVEARAAADKMSQRMERNLEEKMKTMANVRKVEFDRNDYDAALEALRRGLENFTDIQENWSNLNIFLEKINTVIKSDLKEQIPSIIKYSERILINSKPGFFIDEISKKCKKANNRTSYVCHLVNVYRQVSHKYIISQLSDPAQHNQQQLMSAEDIRERREDLYEECQKAFKGMAEMIRSMEKEYKDSIDPQNAIDM